MIEVYEMQKLPDEQSAIRRKVNKTIRDITEKNITSVLCHEDERRKHHSVTFQLVNVITSAPQTRRKFDVLADEPRSPKERI